MIKTVSDRIYYKMACFCYKTVSDLVTCMTVFFDIWLSFLQPTHFLSSIHFLSDKSSHGYCSFFLVISFGIVFFSTLVSLYEFLGWLYLGWLLACTLIFRCLIYDSGS